MPPPQNPHDALFRAVFRVPRYAAGLLKIALPPDLVALLDLDHIEVLDAAHVSPPLRGSASDVVLQIARRAPGGPTATDTMPALIVFAVEHQSREEHFMALRQLQYETRLWEGWLRDHPGATRLPPIVPVVVHTGPTPWRAPTRFQALVDLPDPPSDTLLRPYRARRRTTNPTAASARAHLAAYGFPPLVALPPGSARSVGPGALAIWPPSKVLVSERSFIDEPFRPTSPSCCWTWPTGL